MMLCTQNAQLVGLAVDALGAELLPQVRPEPFRCRLYTQTGEIE
jgi:hypothetical protein